jgi:hypothetical protein
LFGPMSKRSLNKRSLTSVPTLGAQPAPSITCRPWSTNRGSVNESEELLIGAAGSFPTKSRNATRGILATVSALEQLSQNVCLTRLVPLNERPVNEYTRRVDFTAEGC